MEYLRTLISGGAGFIGSNIAIRYKQDNPGSEVIVLDNLQRKGSELNVLRLEEHGITFLKGDVRNPADIASAGEINLLIECSAECSVLAGYNSAVRYLIDTNLLGAINCLEAAKKYNAHFIFLSTSRVYPVEKLNALNLIERESRFDLAGGQSLSGVSEKGISENFPLTGYRSFYGATKLSAELITEEYIRGYGLKGVVNRCGVIAGPGQMGKVDQGFVALWVARHIYGGKLSYIGFGGKQVRDILHVDDLYELLKLQIDNIDIYNGQIYNVGGGINNSISLLEATALCAEVTGKKLNIDLISGTREADVPYYVTDYSKINRLSGWQPKRGPRQIIEDTAVWINADKEGLRKIFA